MIDGVTPEEMAELREFILTRPEAIQKVMERFPPGCTVRATKPLSIPAPGCVGQVTRYLEFSDGRCGCGVAGRLNGVGPFLDAECNADDLELDEEGIVSRTVVAEIIAGGADDAA